MQVFLIEENTDIRLFSKIFKKIELKKDKIIINARCNSMKLKNKIKLVDQIDRILKLNKSNKIILSNSLKQDESFMNLLYSKGIDIVNGKMLFKILVHKIIESICNKNNLSQKEINIGVTTNNVGNWEKKLIEDLSKKFKMVNVVTDKINCLNNLQKKLYDENGIILIITNNKKRALFKCNIILNIDFSEEILNKYTIFDESIIINLEENIKIKKKRFRGRIINDYEIDLKKDSILKKELEDKILIKKIMI